LEIAMLALLFAAAIAAPQPAYKQDQYPAPRAYETGKGYADEGYGSSSSGYAKGGETYSRETRTHEDQNAPSRGDKLSGGPAAKSPLDDPDLYPRQPDYAPPPPYADSDRYGKDARDRDDYAYTGDSAYYDEPHAGHMQRRAEAPAHDGHKENAQPPYPATEYYYGRGELGPAPDCQKGSEPDYGCVRGFSPDDHYRQPAPPPAPRRAEKPTCPERCPEPARPAPPRAAPPPPTPCNCAPPPCNYGCRTSWEEIYLDNGFVATSQGGVGSGYAPPVYGGGGGYVSSGSFAGAGSAANAAAYASASASASASVRIVGGGGGGRTPPPPHGGGGCNSGCGSSHGGYGH